MLPQHFPQAVFVLFGQAVAVQPPRLGQHGGAQVFGTGGHLIVGVNRIKGVLPAHAEAGKQGVVARHIGKHIRQCVFGGRGQVFDGGLTFFTLNQSEHFLLLRPSETFSDGLTN